MARLSKSPPIYVEILIRAPVEAIWAATQEPARHERWDLRFTEIDYLPRPDPAQPQRFRYQTRIGFGLAIRGEGESTGTVSRASGERTSALRFWSADPRSLIAEGSGYWRYIPTEAGVRFLTWYDYRTRFGWPGALFDRLVFRPLIGWATAWSFDRLRRWLESGLDPGLACRLAAIRALALGPLAAIWLYQGLVPKLLFPDGGEAAILRATGLFPGREAAVLALVGLAELAFGLALLWRPHSRWLLHLNNAALVVLLLGALAGTPALAAAPFNPVTLNLAMIALALVALAALDATPTAATCLRRPRREP